MARATRQSHHRGAVLILVLWALGFLAVLAVTVGAGVRQQLGLLARLEKREQLRQAAAAGLHQAVVVGRRYFAPGVYCWTREFKQKLTNDPDTFKQPERDAMLTAVSYFSGEGEQRQERYGILDEESKLNLNTVDALTLSRFFQVVLQMKQQEAQELGRAVINWREPEERELVGFYSQEYYENLEFPYKPKKAKFDRLEELLLVKGFDPTRYRQVKDYLTVFGDGMVDLNTASPVVLLALGMSQGLVDKVGAARRGMDGEEGTDDDFIFDWSNNSGAGFGSYVRLSHEESEEMNALFREGKLGVEAKHFRIVSRAWLASAPDRTPAGPRIKAITAVFQVKDGKIIYWWEE